MKRPASTASWLRRLRRVVVTILVLLVAALVYLGTVGFPGWLGEWLLTRVDTGRFVLTAGQVAYHPFKGLVLHNAAMYARGIVGPPCLRAEEIDARIDLPAAIRREPSLQLLRLRGGRYRPELARHPDPGSQPPPDPWNADFRFELENFVYEGIYVRTMDGHIVAHDMDMTITVNSGTIGADSEGKNMTATVGVNRRRRAVTGHIETTFDPRLLLDYVRAKIPGFTERLIERFAFTRYPPRTSLDFTQEFTGAHNMTVDGQVWMRDCRYRGIDVLRADAAMSVHTSHTNAVVALRPLVVVRPEGLATITLETRPKQDELLYNGESTLDPHALTRMIGIFTNTWFQEDTHFRGTVAVTAEGRVNTRGRGGNRSRLTVQGRGIGYKRLHVDECRFDVISVGRSNRIDNVTGRMCGGDLTGHAVIMGGTNGAPPTYRMSFEVDDADFEDVAEVLTKAPEEDYAGRFSMQLEQAGPISEDHAELVRGTGYIRVKDGRVFMLPVFGGLSKYMTAILPGLDFVISQGDAKGHYKLAKGRVYSEDFAVEGDVLSLSAKGLYYLDKRLDFRTQVKLMKGHPLVGKIVRVITWPISKLFEFRVRGTLDDPEWYPVNFSSELLEKLGIQDKD